MGEAGTGRGSGEGADTGEGEQRRHGGRRRWRRLGAVVDGAEAGCCLAQLFDWTLLLTAVVGGAVAAHRWRTVRSGDRPRR